MFDGCLQGTNKMVEGGEPLSFVSPGLGFPQYYNINQMNNSLNTLNKYQSQSVFCETFSAALQSAVATTQFMGPLVSAIRTNTTFSNSGISAQFAQGEITKTKY
jgi:hypothetical protein